VSVFLYDLSESIKKKQLLRNEKIKIVQSLEEKIDVEIVIKFQ